MKWRRARPLAEELSLEFFDPPTPCVECRAFVLGLVSLINSLTSSHFWQKKRRVHGTWILVDAPRARPARGIVRGPDSPERKMKRIPVTLTAVKFDVCSPQVPTKKK